MLEQLRELASKVIIENEKHTIQNQIELHLKISKSDKVSFQVGIRECLYEVKCEKKHDIWMKIEVNRDSLLSNFTESQSLSYLATKKMVEEFIEQAAVLSGVKVISIYKPEEVVLSSELPTICLNEGDYVLINDTSDKVRLMMDNYKKIVSDAENDKELYLMNSIQHTFSNKLLNEEEFTGVKNRYVYQGRVYSVLIHLGFDGKLKVSAQLIVPFSIKKQGVTTEKISLKDAEYYSIKQVIKDCYEANELKVLINEKDYYMRFEVFAPFLIQYLHTKKCKDVKPALLKESFVGYEELPGLSIETELSSRVFLDMKQNKLKIDYLSHTESMVKIAMYGRRLIMRYSHNYGNEGTALKMFLKESGRYEAISEI